MHDKLSLDSHRNMWQTLSFIVSALTVAAGSQVRLQQCNPITDANGTLPEMIPPVNWKEGQTSFSPALVKVRFVVQEIQRINDFSQTMTILFFIHLQWTDQRLSSHCEFLIRSCLFQYNAEWMQYISCTIDWGCS